MSELSTRTSCFTPIVMKSMRRKTHGLTTGADTIHSISSQDRVRVLSYLFVVFSCCFVVTRVLQVQQVKGLYSGGCGSCTLIPIVITACSCKYSSIRMSKIQSSPIEIGSSTETSQQELGRSMSSKLSIPCTCTSTCTP
jgi:hypothetical protein